MKPKISVYIATSVDGYIAREDGSLDWLEGSGGDDRGTAPESDTADVGSGDEDYGWSEFFNSVDTMVMGRATFQFVAESGQWPYEGKRVFVLSSSLGRKDVALHLADKLEILSMEPSEVVAKLADEGAEHVYVDGGVTIQRFIRAGLIDELIVTRVPVLLGSGIPLFGELNEDVRLRHVESHGFESGLVQSKYIVDR